MADLDDKAANKIVTDKAWEPGLDIDVTSAGVGKVGFYGVDPVVQRAAFTQTYSDAARVVPAATATALTVTDGAGTNDGTIPAITNTATTIAAVQELAANQAALIADDLAIKKVLNALIDDLQALGIIAPS